MNNSLSRRNFLKTSITASGALVVGFTVPGITKGKSEESQNSWQINAWLELDKNGQLTFIIDRVEMGQGTMTGLTTLVAEELDIAPESIKTRFAPAGTDYRNPIFGLQMTGGSTSIVAAWAPIREAAAGLRILLASAAAEVWQVSQQECSVSEGMVFHASKEPLSWSKLIPVATNKYLLGDIPLKPASEFKYIGKRNQRTDSQPKSFGQADYGIDTQIPGMVYSLVIRSPYVGGSLKNLNANNARLSKGVIDIFPISQGIAVVAESYWQARKASSLVDAEWEPGRAGKISSDNVFDLYAQEMEKDDAKVVREVGDYDSAKKSATTITAEYKAPFLAHATMEPQNCVAHVSEYGIEIWAPTQAPDLAQVAASRASDFSPSDVFIHTTYLGGGFGRRIVQDFVAEAVEISDKIRKPVKLVWSREDDTRHDHYRPAALHRMTGTLDEQGMPQLWHHKVACPTLMDWIIKDAAPAMFSIMPKWSYGTLAKIGIAAQGTLAPEDYSPWEGADTIAYDFPAIKLDYAKVDPGIPVTYWRSVGNSHNAFAIESFIDELAHAGKQSPLTLRQKLLHNHPRARNVLDTAADKAGWGKQPAERFLGIGFHFSFDTWVCQIANVSVSADSFKVEKVTCVVDCGTVVNPDIVRAQMESGIIFGLTAALHGEITLKDGQVQQSNFHDYPALRIHEIPEIDVHIVESREPPTGVGEPGLPPIAPAVTNAVFAATGQRLRNLPLKLA
ncbi:molybdopterin cofactor-binding domain-containing protein [Parendozoicomonas sp. Alg238-R29]|uniref:xanthine dehydrogenase family protein molybdopterin-binding subunit n=1 Tax=Parendozoicomonas sp. Alg238-R29 TaxID=2993446 RepID=UPI00248DF3EC|nr:molybdopterin cofactor-binding domain-containing protein [Parendozoicomonas sp. Alg238-R29]